MQREKSEAKKKPDIWVITQTMAARMVQGDKQITEFKTNPDLLKALEAAAGTKMTQNEVREQKIPVVLGIIDETNDVARADVAKLIDERDGKVA